jgi:phenylacetate-CoA ligase
MEQFDRVAADPRLRLAALEAHATGGDPGALVAGEFHVFSTSGTTGRRGIFPQSQAEFAGWVAAAWRVRRRRSTSRRSCSPPSAATATDGRRWP